MGLTTSSGSTIDPGMLAALLGLGGAAGAFPTPTTGSGTTTSNADSSSTTNSQLLTLLQTLSQISGKTSQTGTTSGTTTSGYASPEAEALSKNIAGSFAKLSQPTNLKPYESQQIEQINRNAGATGEAQQEELAARGLSTSPVAGTVAANTEASRVGGITNLQQSLPLLQQQLTLQNLNSANGFLANSPKTTTQTGATAQSGESSQTGTTSQNGSNTTSGNTTTQQSGITNTQQQQQTGGGPGVVFGGLGAILARLFG